MRAVLAWALVLVASPAAGDVVAFTLSSMPLRGAGAPPSTSSTRGTATRRRSGRTCPTTRKRALAEARRRVSSPAGRAALGRIAAAAPATRSRPGSASRSSPRWWSTGATWSTACATSPAPSSGSRRGVRRRTDEGVAAAGLLALAGLAHAGETVTSADILAASADLACLDYQLVGGCVWLRCGLFGCRTRVSVKVRHFVPDAVVTAYPARGRCPWTELRALEGPATAGPTPRRGRAGRDRAPVQARAGRGLARHRLGGGRSTWGRWCASRARPRSRPTTSPGSIRCGARPSSRRRSCCAISSARCASRGGRLALGAGLPAHRVRAADPRLQGRGGGCAARRRHRDAREPAPRLPAAPAPNRPRPVAARAGRRRRCGHPPLAAARPAHGRVRGVRERRGAARRSRRSARRERLRDRRLRLEPVAPVPVLRAARAVAAVALGKLREEVP